jgi:hypothetical protein
MLRAVELRTDRSACHLSIPAVALIGLDGVLRRSGLNLRRLRAQVGIPAVIDLRATPVGCAER